MIRWNLLRFFSFHTSFVSRLSSVSLHHSPERPPPKHSFLSTCCAWFPCPVPTCLLWTSFSYMRLPQRRLFPSIALPKPSFYIHLSSYTTNTAWSVRRAFTLDSGRGKRRLLRQRVTRFPRRASSKDKGQGILEGLLQGMQVLGASAASLSNSRLHKTLLGLLQGERTLKSSTATQRDPGRTE